jgi:hypothetical protein
VRGSALTSSEATLSLSAGGGTTTVRAISIVEVDYAGTFTVSNPRPDVAGATLINVGPGSAQLTVSAQTPGAVLLTISDADGKHLTIPVTVSSAKRTTGTPLRRTRPLPEPPTVH